MKVVGIKFKQDGMVYNFSSELDLKPGDKVIVETERGSQLGFVENEDVKENKVNKSIKLKSVDSLASESDYDKYLKNIKDAKKALIDTRDEIQNLNLNMNLIDASYSLDRKVLLFNFISEERVDFRELVKVLAAKYHTRIELHQVGVRDKAREVGGIGLCGRQLCCASGVNNLCSVNINMVKNQNIALNPTKINGACGRLLCCFNYENEVYEENRDKLPKVGERVTYKNHLCEVVELDVLNMKYKVKTGEDMYEEVSLNDRM